MRHQSVKAGDGLFCQTAATITGGTYTGVCGARLALSGERTVTVTGGEFTGKNALLVSGDSSKVVLQGGSFVASGEGSEAVKTVGNKTANGLLATGYGYYIGDVLQTVEETARTVGGAGQTVTVKQKSAEPEVNTYTATVTLNRDKSVWTDHGRTVKLKAVAGAAEYANGASVPDGTYRILVDGVDTEKTLTVSGTAAGTQLDYYTVTFYDGTVAYESGTAWQPQIVLSGGKAVKPQPESRPQSRIP